MQTNDAIHHFDRFLPAGYKVGLTAWTTSTLVPHLEQNGFEFVSANLHSELLMVEIRAV